MMKRLVIGVLAVMLILPIAAAHAQFKQGDRVFTISGKNKQDKNFDDWNVNLEASFGYFTRSNIEVVLRQELSYVDGDNTDSIWDGVTRIAGNYYIPKEFEGKLKPLKLFVGLSLGYQYGDDTAESFIAGPEGGFKYFFNDTTFANFMMGYHFTFEDSDDADDRFSDGWFDYVLGLGFRF